jgi:predicted Zn-dependent protease
VAGAGRHGKWLSRRLWAAPVLLCAAFTLAACGDINRFQTPSPTAASPPAKPNRTVAQSSPAADREHERILSSYGGAYDDPKL